MVFILNNNNIICHSERSEESLCNIKLIIRILIFVSIVTAASAQTLQNRRDPHIGYLYPAGGRQGTVVQITVGGQFLRDVNYVHISGEGVSGSLDRYLGRMKPLNNDQQGELRKRINEARQKFQARPAAGGQRPEQRQQPPPKDANKPAEANKPPVTLPVHPLILNLDKLSQKGLQKVADEFLANRNPSSMAISELVTIEIKIDANALPGEREIRLGTRSGLTNPLCFYIGNIPEVAEPLFQDPGKPFIPEFKLPFLVNGQIMPGETDRFRFNASRGQNLVVETQARRLIPYIADAVPGWFQPVVALYDSKGSEIAYADDYRFDPDPVLFCRITKDDIYELRIRDSIYRGREDFVYRTSIAEKPFITQVFPLGGQLDSQTVASIGGRNLVKRQLPLDTQEGSDEIRQTVLQQNWWLSNPVLYAVDTLPECNEVESNNSIEDAQKVTLPVIINGKIAKSSDTDVFRFEGKSGGTVVAEVTARRLYSPLDSILKLTDESGKILDFNDDNKEEKNIGLLTHSADSYISFRLPEDGNYFVHLADSQNQSGDSYAYRLRISPPQPDFSLFVTPSSINMPPGGIVPLNIQVIRKDSFDGQIDVVLKDAPDGFRLSGSKIHAGSSRTRVTLTAPLRPFDKPVVLNLEGRAQINNKTIARPVTPAEDMMQAFAYQHLVPSKELVVACISGRRRMPPFELIDSDKVEVPKGGSVSVRVRLPGNPPPPDIRLHLSDPPPGLAIEDVNFFARELTFSLKADEKIAKDGFTDNLIIEVSAAAPRNPQGNPARQQNQRISLGVLPAISCEIVKP